MFLVSSLRQVGRLSRQILVPTIFVFAALCLTLTSHAQTTQNYAGRPFIRVAQANLFDPVSGSPSAFGRSQLVGNSVYFVTLSGSTTTGVYSGRGATHTKIASIGSTLSGVNVVSYHDGFARETGNGSIVIAAGDSKPDRLFLTDGTNSSILVTTGAVMPNSGGKTVSGFGEPYYANGKVAVIAAHLLPNGGGSDFQGVYRVNAGALEAVADIATALPGLGVPDGFSSQLGFDGDIIAFWASRGQFAATNGMFMQTSAGAVSKILQTGDAMPGGGTVDGILSPPVVSAGVVYFYAYDTNRKTSLLKYENGTLTVLAKDDNTTAEGGQIRNLGQFGLGVDAGKVFFPALTTGGVGVYLVENGALTTVVKPGQALGGFVPTSITLQDVAGDTLVLDASTQFARRLVANLAQPAAPVIITNLINQTVAANARAEFSITALGDEPLTYYWYFGGTNFTGVNGNKLVIENAGVGNIGYYYAVVSNAFGTVNSTSGFLGVDVPPTIFVQPTNTTVEAGDQLALIVVANGGQPLTYFWKKDGQPVISDSPALGYFVRTSAQASDAGVYSVTVSNSFGMVTSGDVVVTILPPSPNPSFAGGQFISVLEHDTVLPNTGGSAMDTSVMSESAARWHDGKVTFTGQTLNYQQLGVFTWDNGAYTRVIAPDADLGNGMGNASGHQFVTAHPDAPLVVRAQQLINTFHQPVGLYELEGDALSVIVDTNSVAPNGGGEKFPLFYYDAYQVGEQTVFISLVGGSNTIYRAVGNSVTRVLYDKQDLPVLGTTTSQFQGLAHDGTDIVVTAANSTQQNYVLLRINANGEVSKLLAKGDTLPGTTDTIRNFGSAATDGEAFYFIVYDNSFRVNLVRWQAGVFTRLAGPGMTVEGMGTIQSIETSFPKGAAGKTYFSARVTTPQGTRIAILVADDTGIRPVLIANKLDARRVSTCYLMDVEDERVIVLVVFNNGLRALYANVGTGGEEPLVLEYHRHTGGSILFSVPAGTQLEYAPEITGPWQTSDMPEVNPTGNRFYRLKKVQ